MTELSPAARAVFDAYPYEISPEALAAALQAVADQVVPEPNDWDKDNFSTQALRLRCVVRDQILAIATELKAQ